MNSNGLRATSTNLAANVPNTSSILPQSRISSSTLPVTEGKVSAMEVDPLITPYLRRILELEIELNHVNTEIEFLRSRNLRPIGDIFATDERSKYPWLGSGREAVLSSRVHDLETQLKQAKEELDRARVKESALNHQLKIKCKEFEEKLQYQSDVLKQRNTELSLLYEKNEFLKTQLENAQKDHMKLESSVIAAAEQKRQELNHMIQQHNETKLELERQQSELSAGWKKLSREKDSLRHNIAETESMLLNYKKANVELESRLSDLETREISVQKKEEKLEMMKREMDTLKTELEREKYRSESEFEIGREKIKKVEIELEYRENKLNQREAELGRTAVELEERENELNELKEELQSEKRDIQEARKIMDQHEKEFEEQYNAMVSADRELEKEGTAAYWRQRFEDALKVQATLKQQLQTAQAISASISLAPQTKRKAGMPKAESDTERSTRNVKSKDIETLNQLMKLQEEERSFQVKEKGKKKRKDSDDEKLVEATIDVTQSVGSRRGRKRQQSPEGPIDVRSASPNPESNPVLSTLKRRKYDSHGNPIAAAQNGRDSDAESITGDLRGGASPAAGSRRGSECRKCGKEVAPVIRRSEVSTHSGEKRKAAAEKLQMPQTKRPPRPRTRAAVDSEADGET